MKFLGIKVGDHDYNFSFSDGIKVYYHKTERQLQVKHHGSTDSLLWVPIIKEWGFSPNELDAICVTSDEELYRENIDSSVNYHEIKGKQWFPNIKCPVYRLDHHLAHALSVWPIVDEIPKFSFVFDGDGDFQRSFSIFKDMDLIRFEKVCDVSSFGTILEKTSDLLNIKGHRLDLCGKAMGLKSFGKINLDYKNLIDVFSLTEIDKITNLTFWETITQKRFEDSKLSYLATIHNFAETKFPEFFKNYAEFDDLISFTGGVAQNSVINGKIQEKFPNCIIPPHANDDGLSLGCIEFLRIIHDQKRFDTTGFPFWQNDPEPEKPTDETIKKVAKLLSEGKIVGWHQGRGEIGPRALGNRSILMDPRIPNGKDIINHKIKHRENYRPFGASIIEDYTNKYFDMNYKSPYMLHVVKVKDSFLPSITHIDNTCRVQTVGNEHKYFYKLLQNFNQITNCPILLNTSLNDNGKPISSTEENSINLFENSGLDVLCIGDRIYQK
jgi:carbamoyltransferase